MDISPADQMAAWFIEEQCRRFDDATTHNVKLAADINELRRRVADEKTIPIDYFETIGDAYARADDGHQPVKATPRLEIGSLQHYPSDLAELTPWLAQRFQKGVRAEELYRASLLAVNDAEEAYKIEMTRAGARVSIGSDSVH